MNSYIDYLINRPHKMTEITNTEMQSSSIATDPEINQVTLEFTTNGLSDKFIDIVVDDDFLDQTSLIMNYRTKRNQYLYYEKECDRKEVEVNELAIKINNYNHQQEILDKFCQEHRPQRYSVNTWKRLSLKNRLAAIANENKKLSCNIVKQRRVIKHQKRQLKKTVKQYFHNQYEIPLKQ